MKIKILLNVSFIFLLSFLAIPSMAQNKIVTGVITDAKTGTPIPGVSVGVKGTTIGVSSSADGSFKLSVPQGSSTLMISFLGYVTQNVTYSGEAQLKIKLVSNDISLGEVVVVGYGTQAKKDVTGAVSRIASKDFNQGAIVNPLDQLQGKVAGLVIQSQGGDPNNQGATISIRGQTSILGNQAPLFVIDGVATSDNSQFQNLSPADIESYDVLKDASATAIYGSRGANGVIIVTTKKGKSGNMQVDYSAFVGFSKQAKYFDLLNAAEYTKAISAIPGVDEKTFLKGGSTDWQKAITRNNALTSSNNVAIGGGSNGFTYHASVSYQDQKGIVLNTGKRQLGLRFNAEQKALNNKLVINLNISNTNVYRDLITDDDVLPRYVFNAPPTFPVYNPDGSYYTFTDQDQANPVEHLKERTNKSTSVQTLASGSANYTLIPGLKVGVLGVLIRDNTLTNSFTPSFPGVGNINSAGQSSFNNSTYETNAHINYDKSFGKHNISATAVYEFNDFITQNFNASGSNYLVPEQLDNNLGSGDQLQNSIGSGKTEYRITSFLGRINYNYDQRFYATVSIRRDGSDKFGKDHQYGTFPSANVAYRAKSDLLKNVRWIDDLKIRAGYGVVGNSNAIDPYNAIVLFSSGNRYYDGSNPSYHYPTSYLYGQNANPDLQWEERRGRNIGVDFSLFNGRLSGDINYYNDKTVKMLYNYTVPTPPFLYGNIFANVGSLTNKGLEIALTGQPIRGKDLTWTVNGQINFVKTKVISLSGTYNGFELSTDQILTGSAYGRGLNDSPLTYLKPGYPVNVFYISHFTGVNANGEQLFDGKALDDNNPNAENHYIDPNPKFNYGLTNSFSYHNIDLSFVLRGVYGQKVYNNLLMNIETVTRLPGTNTTNEALTNGIKDGIKPSDLWLQPASFLRLDNASIGYAFKNVKGFSNLRIYIAGNNLFVLTKYRGLDPEVQGGTFFDNNSYPKIRSFVIGTNISFK